MKIETNLTTYLMFLFTIVPGKIWFGSIAGRTGTIVRDITFGSAKHRLYGFAVTFFIVRNEVIPFPVLFVGNDTRKFINLKLLILW